MIITSPTTFTSSVDTVTRKGGIFKISSLGALEYISRQRPSIEATSLTGLIELAQLGTTIIDGGYIKTELVDSNTLLTDVLFVGDILEGGYLKPSLIDVSTLVTNMSLGALAYESVVEASKLGTTLIEGGFIKTNLIDTDALLADVVVVGDLGAVAGLDAIELTNLGTTIISGGYIKTNLLQTDVLRVGQADLTAQNTAYNTTYVGGYAASSVAYWASHPAEVINNNVTTISGGKITTGSLAANKIISYSISTPQLAAGAVTAINLAARSVVAGKIAAESITVSEIYGLARINGNRLQVVEAGTVYLLPGQEIQITHNLGRYVIIMVESLTFINLSKFYKNITTNGFTLVNSAQTVAHTVLYAYI